MAPFYLSTLRLLAILSISVLPTPVKAKDEIDIYLTQAHWPSEIIGWIPEDYNPEDPSYGLHVKAEPDYIRRHLKVGDYINYNYDKRNQRWMRRIPDATPISALSLPGTHASAFFGKTIDKTQRSQNFNVKKQIEAGIRYLDFPLYTDGHNPIVSNGKGKFDSGFGFMRIFKDVVEYLQKHPTEGMIVRFRQDPLAGNSMDASLAEQLNHEMELLEGPYGVMKYHGYIYEQEGGIVDLPTMGQLRQKMLILTDIPGINSTWALQYRSPLINRGQQPEPRWNSFDDFENKWHIVSRHLDEANESQPQQGRRADNRLFITQTAGDSGKIIPECVAVGTSGSSGVEVWRSNRKPTPTNPGIFQKITNLFPWKSKPAEPTEPVMPTLEIKTVQMTAGRNRVKTNRLKNIKDHQGINARTLKKLSTWRAPDGIVKSGIVVMDFPGQKLINTIISFNFA